MLSASYRQQFLGGMILNASPTKSGVAVNQDTALTYSAVWSATLILTETLAMCPAKLERRRAAGKGWDRAWDNDVDFVINGEPNPDMDAFSFWALMFPFTLNAGVSYARKERSMFDRRVIALWPILPRLVRPRRREDGKVEFEVKDDLGRVTDTLPREDVLCLPGSLSEDGIIGKGVVQMARESIGAGMAGVEYHANLLANGGQPTGLLTRPVEAGPLDKKGEEALLESWVKGLKAGKRTVHLQEGYEYTALAFKPVDAQFLESRKFDVNEIARWYRLPPHMLAELSDATYSNIDAQDRSFAVKAVQPWATRIEQSTRRQLLSLEERRSRRYRIKFNLDALLRGDPEKRAKAHQIEFMHGALNGDEWREHEGRNPLPDGLGQVHYVPANLRRVDQPGAEEPEPPADPQQGAEETMATAAQVEGVRDALVAANAAANESLTDMATALDTIVRHRQPDPGVVGAAAEVIYDAASRMLTKESNAAKRAAGKPREFLHWLDAFYCDHHKIFADAIGPGMAAWCAAHGGAANAVRLAYLDAVTRSHIKESRRLLLEAAECQPDELPGRVAECIASWPTERRRIALPPVPKKEENHAEDPPHNP
jgi:HK97 family phage portal protein